MGYLLLPFGVFAGWLAGAAMSRRMVRSEVQRLQSLIESTNGKAVPAPAPVPVPTPVLAAATAPQPPEPEKVEEVTPETIMILTAAVAAFLGKRARIRSARMVRTAPSNAWAQQGRVFVQASHNLGVMHGR